MTEVPSACMPRQVKCVLLGIRSIKGAWNLQCTTYTFGEEERSQHWDRKDWSYRKVSLRFVSLFSQARLLFVITLLWSAMRPAHSQLHDPVRCAPARDILRTVRYGIVPTFRHDSQNWRWNLPLYSVLYNELWRSSSLVKNLERRWRNGWCLTRRLAMSVASRVPNFFSFSTWCESFARDIGFKWRLDLQRPLLGVQHEEKEMPTLSFTFGEKALLLDGFLWDRDSRIHAINPSRFARNLQDTTYPFGNEKRAQRWDGKDWS